MTYILKYWQVGVTVALIAVVAAWWHQRDERLKAEARAEVISERFDSLNAVLTDSIAGLREQSREAVDTVEVVVRRVERDTVTVERLAEQIREVVPDSIVAKVDSLETAYNTAVEALGLARVAIVRLENENRALYTAKANLEQQVAALQDAQGTRPGWLDTGVKVLAGVGVGYVLATR